jgi:SAM-dependent methyltransferase
LETLKSVVKEALSVLGAITATALLLDAISVIVMFPYHTDRPEKITFRPAAADQKFYDQTYTQDERQLKYVQIARRAAEEAHVAENIAGFVQTYRLQNARVLEVGAGSGLLQDQVRDYTGLDLSATARRYFRKPFVQADARAMPFPAESFDAAWSIWVLEHVPNPEMALAEMRRVLKPNGVLLLWPAWRVSPLAAHGYHARPYGDFDIGGKIVKASIGLRESLAFEACYTVPVRLIRRSTYDATQRQAAFHYRRLSPNYEQYWEADSDAVNSLDRYETYLWFKSRGDLCLNCSSDLDTLRTQETQKMYLVIRVKPTSH